MLVGTFNSSKKVLRSRCVRFNYKLPKEGLHLDVGKTVSADRGGPLRFVPMAVVEEYQTD